MDSRSLYYYGRELLFHGQYKKGKEIFHRFLEREDGWLENRIDATRQMAILLLWTEAGGKCAESPSLWFGI